MSRLLFECDRPISPKKRTNGSNDVRAIILQNCRTRGCRMLDWNDLRYFLSVARKGSTLAAGRELRVSQTTVARRIAALEAGARLPDLRKAAGRLRR